jgi:hypothetical protein
MVGVGGKYGALPLTLGLIDAGGQVERSIEETELRFAFELLLQQSNLKLDRFGIAAPLHAGARRHRLFRHAANPYGSR